MTDSLLDELLIGCLNITTGNFSSTFPEPQSDGNTRPLFSSLNITSLSCLWRSPPLSARSDHKHELDLPEQRLTFTGHRSSRGQMKTLTPSVEGDFKALLMFAMWNSSWSILDRGEFNHWARWDPGRWSARDKLRQTREKLSWLAFNYPHSQLTKNYKGPKQGDNLG